MHNNRRSFFGFLVVIPDCIPYFITEEVGRYVTPMSSSDREDLGINYYELNAEMPETENKAFCLSNGYPLNSETTVCRMFGGCGSF
jgi:hypothetical protein